MKSILTISLALGLSGFATSPYAETAKDQQVFESKLETTQVAVWKTSSLLAVRF